MSKAFRKIIYVRSFFTNKEACVKYSVKSLMMIYMILWKALVTFENFEFYCLHYILFYELCYIF